MVKKHSLVSPPTWSVGAPCLGGDTSFNFSLSVSGSPALRLTDIIVEALQEENY